MLRSFLLNESQTKTCSLYRANLRSDLPLEREARILADNAVGNAETQIDVVSKQSEDVITQWQENGELFDYWLLDVFSPCSIHQSVSG